MCPGLVPAKCACLMCLPDVPAICVIVPAWCACLMCLLDVPARWACQMSLPDVSMYSACQMWPALLASLNCFACAFCIVHFTFLMCILHWTNLHANLLYVTDITLSWLITHLHWIRCCQGQEPHLNICIVHFTFCMCILHWTILHVLFCQTYCMLLI